MLKRFGFPFLTRGGENEFHSGDVLYLVIDRTQWSNVNLLMISLVYNRRAIPIYFTLLGKLGNTNATEQKWFLAIALDLLKDYPKVILGDREFCSVDLAKWLSRQSHTYFSLRLKKNTCIQLETQITAAIKRPRANPWNFGLSPGGKGHKDSHVLAHLIWRLNGKELIEDGL